MPAQKVWTDVEAAILLEALIKVLNGDILRKDAIKYVSTFLRKMAIDSGFEIDEIYRNVNGITFQMHSMESAYRGYTILKPASKLFLKIVELRKTDEAAYSNLIKEAMSKMDNRDKFNMWLSANPPKKYTTEAILNALQEASDYCCTHSICKSSFWDMSELGKFTAASNKLLGMRIYRLGHRNTAAILDKAVPMYREFLKQNSGIDENHAVAVEVEPAMTKGEGDSSVEDPYKKTFQKLLSISKVYDDPSGVSFERIISFLGSGADANLVKTILDEVPWATKVSDEVYSFAQKTAIAEEKDELVSVVASTCRVTVESFTKYLLEKAGTAEATCRSYVSTIRSAENYALAHHFPLTRLYNCDPNDTVTLMQTLLSDAEFLEYNKNQHNRFKAAFAKMFEMIGVSLEDTTVKYKVQSKVCPDDFDRNKFIATLLRRYPSGMQFDSIDFENFRDMYEMLYDEKLGFDDSALEERLRYCGVIYKERVFPAEGIMDNSAKEKLFSYIDNSFASGNKVLYYKSIFADLSDVFAYCFSLTDEEMLKVFIEHEAEEGKYYFFDNYLSNQKDVKIDHAAEITDYLLAAGKPLSFDDIYAGLSHISSDLIYRETQLNPSFIRNEKSHYFHVDIFELSQEDADQISSFISEEIEEDGYAIWSRVYVRIQEELPVFLENNLYLSSLGIRNALANKIGDRFNFESEVISESGQHLSMGDVYTLYARHHAPFSDVDLYNFSKEIGTVIYFGAVAESATRVSKNLFVSKDQIEFDVAATDKALETYLTDGYILAKDVDSFLVFPNVGYEWNEYLLESYLTNFSKKYALVNNGTSLNNVAGAIVIRDGQYSEFVDICADVLANSDIDLKKDIALDYLAQQNLITRRSYREIDVAITKARQIRNRRG